MDGVSLRGDVVLGFDQWVDLLVGVMKVGLGCICNTFQFVKSIRKSVEKSKKREMRCDDSNIVCVGIVYIYIYEAGEARREEWS